MNLKQSEKLLYELEPIDQQLAVTFSHDGSLLAVGREYRMVSLGHSNGPAWNFPSPQIKKKKAGKGVADVRDGHGFF